MTIAAYRKKVTQIGHVKYTDNSHHYIEWTSSIHFSFWKIFKLYALSHKSDSDEIIRMKQLWAVSNGTKQNWTKIYVWRGVLRYFKNHFVLYSTNVVMNYSEVETKVREATNDDAWGPHGQIMQEIARYTFTYEHFPEVMGMLWKRMLHDNKKNWRRTYKV